MACQYDKRLWLYLEREPSEGFDDELPLPEVGGFVNARQMSGQRANVAENLERKK